MRQRDLSLDLLRIMACVMVVIMHSPIPSENANGLLLSSLSYFTAPCIGLFFMVSGALILPPPNCFWEQYSIAIFTKATEASSDANVGMDSFLYCYKTLGWQYDDRWSVENHGFNSFLGPRAWSALVHVYINRTLSCYTNITCLVEKCIWERD